MSIEERNSLKEKVKLTANILFSGIGAQERGFRNSNLFDIEVLSTSDISKEAVVSYAAIHCGLTNEMVESYTDYPSRDTMAQYLMDINLGYDPEKNKHFDWFKLVKRKKNDLEKYWLACKLTNNLGDISKVEELPYADLWTISFCCQDISVAGKMKGLKPDSGTRSSLLWDNIKLLEKAKNNKTLPQYVMFENVKNLVSKKFINDFNDLIDVMDELGFNTYWDVLNGKDCGIPQNRERVFVISIRKDIDNKSFKFPVPFDNGLRLKDMLEDTVEDKYYLSDVATRKFQLFDKNKGNDILVAGSINPDKKVQDRVRVLDSEGISQGLRATDYKDPVKIITVGCVNSSQDGVVVDPTSISKTLVAGHNNQPKILCGIDKSINDTSFIKYANCLTTREDRGISNRKSEGTEILELENDNKLKQIGYINDYNGDANRVYSDNLARTLKSEAGGGGAKTGWYKTGIRIRKLTPLECWRLMGFNDNDVRSCTDIGIADTHLYKQAGNSIVTNCIELIAEHLYKAQYDNTYVCYDEKMNSENFTKPQVE